MRTLLVDIYPPNLETGGLFESLRDLVTSIGNRDIDMLVELDPAALELLDARHERLVYRVAHECLRNMTLHSRASSGTLAVTVVGDDVVLHVTDNGVGFDVGQTLTNPPPGHFGLRILADVAADHGAFLAIRSSAAEGTEWVLRIAGESLNPDVSGPRSHLWSRPAPRAKASRRPDDRQDVTPRPQ
jgi:two-component system, NarL family, sensor kinase